MKVTFENIAPDQGSSFRMIDWKSENDKFFWHQHPEYEIIYIKKGNGQMRVGDFQGRYEEGHLFFLGPNIPHTGLGYGVVGEHEEVIVQLREDFLGKTLWQAPEMVSIHRLFERSHEGISFTGPIRLHVGDMLENLLVAPPFERLMGLFQVLHTLALTADYELLGAKGDMGSHQDEHRMQAIYHYIAEHYAEPLNMEALAEVAHLTVPSFCRYFKRKTRQTCTDFVNEYRVNQACKRLQSEAGISQVAFDVGFNNLSHFNKTFKRVTGVSPKEYRRLTASDPHL